MAILVQQSEATAAYRRMYFHCVDATDGMTPETGEAGGQPQISLNGAAWGNTTNVLVAIGNGRYYVELVAATEVNSLGIIEGRYKSANTAEAVGITLQVVPFDPYDGVRAGLTALPNADADAAGGLPISDAGGLDLDTKLANTNEVTAARMEALTDWINGGRLDLILDIIAADVVNIDGATMRGTDDANTTVPDAAGTAASLISSHDTDIDDQLAIIAGYIDTEIGNLLDRLTAARAGYLDKLDVPGTLAHSNAAATYKADVSNLDVAVSTRAPESGGNVAAIKAKTDNLPAIPAALGSEMNLADDAITSDKYDESTAHPITTAMQKAGSTIITGKVSHDNTPATTTVFYSDDITEATADHYNGRIVIFTSGALAGQATDITDYELDTGEGKFTVTALTEAPADNVTFVIV